MKVTPFERIAPNQVKVGDILMCRAHDDQLEYRSTRVVDIELDNVPGVYTWPDGYSVSYDYLIRFTCRHVNMKRLDVQGGPAYHWELFPWNGVVRYLLNVPNPDSSTQICP